MTALLLALLLTAQAPAAQPQAAGRILVVPFENAQREARLHWLSEACAVALADALNARGLPAITRAERVRAFEQLRLPLSASLSRATIIKVGQLVGASEVIVGSFRQDGAALIVEAHSIRVDVGRLRPDVTERAPLPQFFTVFERLSQRLAPDSSASAGTREPRPPLEAFEHYVKGLVAESLAAQATFLETAIKLHPAYDRARLALWDVRTEQGDHAAALAAVRAVPEGSTRERRARFLAGVSLLDLKRYDEAFDTFTHLLDDTAADDVRQIAAIANNLGVVQMRRGATQQTGSAAYHLTKAADADPWEPDSLFNLGYAYALERNNEGAIYWLREALRRNPADADAHYVLSAALHGSGSTVEAAREKELAQQLSSRYEELDQQAAAEKLPVPRGLERVRAELDAPRALRPEQTIVNSAQREQQDLAVFHRDRGRRLFEREEDREAMAELRRAVYLSPYEAQAHLLIGRIYLRAGRPREAVDALKISIWSQDSSAARIALGEAYLKLGDTASAKTELERALALDPSSAEARKLLADIR